MKKIVSISLLTTLSFVPSHAQSTLGMDSQTETLVPSIVLAQALTQEVLIQSLSDQGFAIISTSRTFFGRIRIKARKDNTLREVIMSRSTGEILSDRYIPLDDDSELAETSTQTATGTGGGQVGGGVEIGASVGGTDIGASVGN